MTFPKIKWRVEMDMYGPIWYTIIAEVELESAQYGDNDYDRDSY